jgi:hypothetical protein
MRDHALDGGTRTVDGGKDGPDHRAGDRNLGQLEGGGAGVAHHSDPDLDQV